jgi:asparagine synthase (glutamine-hydrolysing)
MGIGTHYKQAKRGRTSGTGCLSSFRAKILIMCGIAGHLGTEELPPSRIQDTIKLMEKRGPDAQDYCVMSGSESQITLVHTRLSIIDIEKRSNQPFTIGPCSVIFNGELYNYLELKSELKKQGVIFTTSSDTEVLLQCYLKYGIFCTKKFEGMWSFAIWDSRTEELILSRDRFGEKPLYYTRSGGDIFFASEIKALKALSGNRFEINEDQLLRYMILGYKSLYKKPQTFLREVIELESGCSMVVSRHGECKTLRYWEPEISPRSMSLDEAVEGARYYLEESIRIRLRSDVPMAFCLSGGVDSAALVSIAAKKFNADVTTFSIIESDERYNEYDNIMATINDIECKHYLLDIPQIEGMQRLKNLIAYHDAPVATTTYYVHSLLSEAMNKNGYKVAFSGTAADELFSGYNDHFLLHLNEMRSHKDYETYLNDWQKNISVHVRNPFLKNPDLYHDNPNFREHIFDNSPEFLEWLKPGVKESFNGQYSEESYCSSLFRNRMLNELFQEAIPVILHEDDLNSMYNSVENRSPYLDSRLFKFMNSVPSEHLIQNGYGKYVLRKCLDGTLNDSVRLDRQKKGFNASINSILDLKNKNVREKVLDPDNKVYEWIEYDKVRALFDIDDLSNHYSKFIFNLVNTQLFLELNE